MDHDPPAMDHLTRLTNVANLAAEADLISVTERTRSIRTGTTVGLGVVSGRAIMAVGELVLKGIEVIQIQRALRTAALTVRRGNDPVNQQVIKDLLELQRVGLYSNNIRQKALDILMSAMDADAGTVDDVLSVLIHWPHVELQLFLKQLAVVRLNGSSFSSVFVRIFPDIINRLLEHEPRIVHDTFNLQDMCFLLSGKDARELKQRLLQHAHLAPMDIFLSGLVTFSTNTRTRDGAATMASYLHSSPQDLLQFAIRRLGARIRMRPLVSASDLDPDDEYKDLRHYVETLLGIIEFTILLINRSAEIRKELLNNGIGDSIAEASEACSLSIDMFSTHEVEILLPLSIAFHRTLSRLQYFLVDDERVGSCRREVLAAFIHTTPKWSLVRSTHEDSRLGLYRYALELISQEVQNEDTKAGWILLLTELWSGNLYQFIEWLGNTPDGYITQHIVLREIMQYKATKWSHSTVDEWASIWLIRTADTILQDLVEECDIFISRCEKNLLSFEGGVRTSEVLLELSPQMQDVHQELPLTFPLIRRLSTYSIVLKKIFTERYPFLPHVVYIKTAPEAILRPFLGALVSCILPDHHGERSHHADMTTVIQLLVFVVRLILSSSRTCRFLELEGLLGRLEMLWAHSTGCDQDICQQIRVWIVVVLSATIYQYPPPDEHIPEKYYGFMFRVYTHRDIIWDALRIHLIVYHLLAAVPVVILLPGQYMYMGVISDENSHHVQWGRDLLNALTLRDSYGDIMIYGLRRLAIQVINLDLDPHRYIFVKAIKTSPYLQKNLVLMLWNVENTHQLDEDGNPVPSWRWTRQTVLCLLKSIRIAACGSGEVAEAIHSVWCEFARLLLRFRYAEIKHNPGDLSQELQRLCIHFELGASDVISELHHVDGESVWSE